jgi:hypothetical protein
MTGNWLSPKAQSDFDRVELSPRPRIPEAEGCIQSQAAALAVSRPKNAPCFHTGKVIAFFADAAATHDTRQFLNAATEFDKAIEAWPWRFAQESETHSSRARFSGAARVRRIARLQASTQPEAVAAVRDEIAAALESPLCNSNLMSASSCRDLLTAGAQWLGWIALRANQMDEAARRFLHGAEFRLERVGGGPAGVCQHAVWACCRAIWKAIDQ